MASFRQIAAIVLLAAAIAFPAAFAKDHRVGDGQGWRLHFDYQAWAKDKQFYVGDRLIFEYNRELHNVLRLGNGYDFQNCVKPVGLSPLNSGKDVITLSSSGTKWYTCGVLDHCSRGMKLLINVNSPPPYLHHA